MEAWRMSEFLDTSITCKGIPNSPGIRMPLLMIHPDLPLNPSSCDCSFVSFRVKISQMFLWVLGALITSYWTRDWVVRTLDLWSMGRSLDNFGICSLEMASIRKGWEVFWDRSFNLCGLQNAPAVQILVSCRTWHWHPKRTETWL